MIQKARFFSKEHREFVRQASQDPFYNSIKHKLALCLLPLFQKSQLFTITKDGSLAAGIILAKFFLPAYGRQTAQRKTMFQFFSSQGLYYGCYAFVSPRHRRQGLFKQLIQHIQEPFFCVTWEESLEKTLISWGAKPYQDRQGNPVFNRLNGEKTQYLVMLPSDTSSAHEKIDKRDIP